jgi:hypothetical protein
MPFGFDELLQVLRVALGGRWFGLVAATMIGLMGREHVRTGKTVAPEQGHNYEPNHQRTGNFPHPTSVYA